NGRLRLAHDGADACLHAAEKAHPVFEQRGLAGLMRFELFELDHVELVAGRGGRVRLRRLVVVHVITRIQECWEPMSCTAKWSPCRPRCTGSTAWPSMALRTRGWSMRRSSRSTSPGPRSIMSASDSSVWPRTTSSDAACVRIAVS